MPGSRKEMFYCNMEDPDCRYALSVGYDYLCKHSDNETFVERDDQDDTPAADKRKEQVA